MKLIIYNAIISSVVDKANIEITIKTISNKTIDAIAEVIANMRDPNTGISVIVNEEEFKI